ncbi:hypothetical protein GCM10027612_63060 [Microbispora bryophytorum subsp. camponoti]
MRAPPVPRILDMPPVRETAGFRWNTLDAPGLVVRPWPRVNRRSSSSAVPAAPAAAIRPGRLFACSPTLPAAPRSGCGAASRTRPVTPATLARAAAVVACTRSCARAFTSALAARASIVSPRWSRVRSISWRTSAISSCPFFSCPPLVSVSRAAATGSGPGRDCRTAFSDSGSVTGSDTSCLCTPTAPAFGRAAPGSVSVICAHSPS